MKNKYILIYLLLILPSIALSQVKADWSLVYHPLGNTINKAYVVDNQLRLDSQGNIVCGWQNAIQQFPQYSSLGVASFNSSGGLNWEHEYYGSFGGSNYLHSCMLDSADNVYMMGVVNSSTFVEDDVNLKYNSAGNFLWKVGDDSINSLGIDATILNSSLYMLSGLGQVYRYNLQNGILFDSIRVDSINGLSSSGLVKSQTAAGNLYLLGYYWNNSAPNNTDLYIAKINSAGNIAWKKVLKASLKEDICFSVVADADQNSYLLARTNYISSTTAESIFTCALDSMGDTLWTRFYNPTASIEHCYASDILTDNKGHVYITANAMDLNTSRWNAVVVQYDALTGNKNWESWFDSSVVYNLGGVKLQMDSAGYIYMGFNKISSGYLGFDIVKLDSLGNTIWHASFDTIGDNNAFVYDGNGTFFCGGNKLSKFSLVSGIDEGSLLNNFLSVYPNPVSDKLYFKNFMPGNNTRYLVYDYSGRVVKTGYINSNQGIEVKEFKPGMFIITILAKDKVYKGKFLKI